MTGTVELLGLPFDALMARLDELGIGRAQAPRLFRALHKTHTPLDALADFGPRHLATLRAHSTTATAAIARAFLEPDGTERLIYTLADGARVEGVLIPMPRPPKDGVPQAPRLSLCLSTQVGCAVGCAFCATGTLGLSRSLTAGELIAQIHAATAHRGQRPTHLVLMGMGEPLWDAHHTIDALKVLLDRHGLSFDARRVTVSTVGLTEGIAKLADAFGGRIQLALSLHAGTDKTRQRLIPLAARYPLADLAQALRAWPLPGKRMLMLEYVVLPGVNDTDAELLGLADFVQSLELTAPKPGERGTTRAIVNLIPFNPFPGAPFTSPSLDHLAALALRLSQAGVPASVRRPRGRAVNAACGQLALATRGLTDALPGGPYGSL